MAQSSLQFIIAPDILKSGIKGIFFQVNGIKNLPNHEEFNKYRKEIVEEAFNYVQNIDIKEDRYIKGFRKLHDFVGAPNRKNLSSPENLYKLLSKKGDIPSINLLVDIYNTISLKYKLALGAHDLSKIEGNIYFRLTNGDENFVPLGESSSNHVRKGDYAYIDENNDILCYLEVKQVEKTKVLLDTTDVFFILQGNEETPFEYIKEAYEELSDLIRRYCGGNQIILGQIE